MASIEADFQIPSFSFVSANTYTYKMYFDSWRIKNQLDITSIFRSLRLCCWTNTLAVLFLDCCVLELGCGSAGVVSGLPADAQLQPVW